MKLKQLLIFGGSILCEIDKYISMLSYTLHKTSVIDGFKKHEVSEANLKSANYIIEQLIHINNTYEHHTVKMYSSIDGKLYTYSLLTAYRKCKLESHTYNDIISIFKCIDMYNYAVIADSLPNLTYFRTQTLCEQLNDIVRDTFKHKILVFVDKHKGFYPVKNMNMIICNRITQNLPRGKYIPPISEYNKIYLY